MRILFLPDIVGLGHVIFHRQLHATGTGPIEGRIDRLHVAPVESVVSRFLHGDQEDHVVTILVPKGNAGSLSARRGSGGGAGSRSTSLRPFTDTAEGPSSQPSQGRPASPRKSVAEAGAVATGEIRRSNVRAMRRLVPFQNVFYLRGLFDQAAEGVARALGVER